MSKNSLELKIAYPYARALLLFVYSLNNFKRITQDFLALKELSIAKPDFMQYLKNPIVSKSQKLDTVSKMFKRKAQSQTFEYLTFLINRDRIGLLPTIIDIYINEMYREAKVIQIEVISASKFAPWQIRQLGSKLKQITAGHKINITGSRDKSLIGGFLIRTKSKQLDFTIRTRLKNLAKHLDTFLDI
jgi:ATP synthase F1 delta subunit